MVFTFNDGNAPIKRHTTLKSRNLVLYDDSISYPTSTHDCISLEASNIDNIQSSETNVANNNISFSKLKYEAAASYKYPVLKCTCTRPSKAYECGRCHQYFRGRISELCEQHPTELFLMDFRQCPYCLAPTTMIQESALSWEQIRKIEDATLPDSSDEL